MKKLLKAGVALSFGDGALPASRQRRHHDRDRRSDDRPVRRVRRADEGRRRAGGRRHQRRGRRARPEARARSRRRRLRSEAGGRGRQPAGRQGASPLVAGHFCSGSSIPASAVYTESSIIQISPASTNPKFTDERPGKGTLRVCGRDDQQGAVAGAFLAKNFADKKIAIIDDKSAYGKGLADETRKYMNGGRQEGSPRRRRTTPARRTTRRWSPS